VSRIISRRVGVGSTASVVRAALSAFMARSARDKSYTVVIARASDQRRWSLFDWGQ